MTVPTATANEVEVATPVSIASHRLVLRLGFWKALLWASFLVVAFLAVAPCFYLAIWAFEGTETIGRLAGPPTFSWFIKIIEDPEWQQSLIYSAVLGVTVSMVGAALLTLHFYFMRYSHQAWDRLAYAFIFLVATIPSTIYALGLRLLGGRLAVPELVLVGIGHLIFVMSIQFFVLESGQERVPSERLFAGSTLGATHLRNIWFCYLPLMRETVTAAFLVGLFFSLDELVVATFVIDSTLVTVPRRLWDQVNRGMTPAPAVLAIVFALTYVLTGFGLASLNRFWRQKE